MSLVGNAKTIHSNINPMFSDFVIPLVFDEITAWKRKLYFWTAMMQWTINQKKLLFSPQTKLYRSIVSILTTVWVRFISNNIFDNFKADILWGRADKKRNFRLFRWKYIVFKMKMYAIVENNSYLLEFWSWNTTRTFNILSNT